MANKNRPRKPARTKSAPKPAEKPAPQPVTVPARITPFDGGMVNTNAPLMVLVQAMFSAPDAPDEIKDPATKFLANVLLSCADETEIMGAAEQEGTLDRSGPLSSCAMRTEWRARIAVEIARRMVAGEVAS